MADCGNNIQLTCTSSAANSTDLNICSIFSSIDAGGNYQIIAEDAYLYKNNR